MNFADILNTKMEDVERPPLPPLGTYRAVVKKVPELGEASSAKGEWDTVNFFLQAVEPVTVDPDALEQYGGVKNIAEQRLTFMFDRHDAVKQDQTKFRMRTFLEKHLGLKPGMDFKEAFNESVGQSCLIVLRYRPDPNDPEIQYCEIGKTAPVE